ncbi:uncharacterized protein CELE_T14E8.2 [Caenorhabditis elegans]|uniref:Secreted protein n=1 Tax=Caenorhabditis elegans TaxID=6239 RepID=Q22488_CAEEL|nr:Secreted protein [Caenorhabditis elegans]CCD83403.2 Secreted protein [Caenorhabditis elegans]|eukprot:NP_509103.2 Uncharacterized protein CELE_T14E8.2 [Caenorhabditis elegans]
MRRWFSVILLPFLVKIILAQELEEKNSLTRPIHPRRHKRAEQVRPPLLSTSPFMLWKNDPKCMIPGRDMMACPKKDPNDPLEKLVCIEPSALCDDHRDCHGAEDEDPHFCMFKKLEDAAMRRVQAEILVLVQNNRKLQPGVVVHIPDKPDTGIVEPLRPGVFKVEGLGPLAKSKMYMNEKDDDDVNKSVEESDEEEENQESEEQEDNDKAEKEEERRRQEEAARQHSKRRRTLRHLLQLKASYL